MNQIRISKIKKTTTATIFLMMFALLFFGFLSESGDADFFLKLYRGIDMYGRVYKEIAVNYVDDFAVKATSVASRGRHAKQERFAIVAMVELCMLDKDVDGKEISVKEATRLLAANPELKTGQADALETKYYKCLGELKGHPAAVTRLNMMRDHLPAMLSDPDLRARIVGGLSVSENEYFPVRIKK